MNAGANALSQLVVRGGKINWQQVATDTILNFTSSSAQRYVDNGNVDRNAELMAQQRREMGNDTPVANQDSAFTGERISVAGGIGRTDSPIGRQLENEQQDLLSTDPSKGGLTVKADAADSVKKQTENLNAENVIEKSSLQAPVMNGAMSLLDPNSSFYGLSLNQYINANSASNLLIDPSTGFKDMRYTTDVRNAEQAAIVANTPKMQYDNHVLQDGDKNPSLSLLQARRNFNQSLEKGIVGGTVAGAALLVSPYLGARTVVALTGTMDVGGQYYLSDNSKSFAEQYKPMQTLFSMGTAGVSVKLGGFVTSTSSPYLNTLNSGLLGGSVSYINTSFTNSYYDENKDPVFSFGVGFGFGATGSYFGGLTSKALSVPLVNPIINRNAPIIYQNYSNPRADYWGNAVLGTTISNIPSFIDTSEKRK